MVVVVCTLLCDDRASPRISEEEESIIATPPPPRARTPSLSIRLRAGGPESFELNAEDLTSAKASAEAQLENDRIRREAADSEEATRRAGAELLRCHKLFVNEVRRFAFFILLMCLCVVSLPTSDYSIAGVVRRFRSAFFSLFLFRVLKLYSWIQLPALTFALPVTKSVLLVFATFPCFRSCCILRGVCVCDIH